MSRSRGWTFTMFETDAETQAQLVKKVIGEGVRYCVYEEEVAPTTGKKHLQGYIYFHNAKIFEVVQRIIPNAHLEAAKGTPQQNRKYCTKDHKADPNVPWFEHGICPTQGKRTDIEEIKTMVKNGVGMDKICDAASSYQAMRTAELMQKYTPCKMREPPKVMWFYGPTGTGKTRTAFEIAGDDVWVSGKSLRWWDGYYGQKTVIIDDYREEFAKLPEMLRILDRYPYRVEVKGGSTWLQATTIIITTPKRPEFTFSSGIKEDIQQLLRRITEIREFKNEVLVLCNTEVGVIVDPTSVDVNTSLTSNP